MTSLSGRPRRSDLPGERRCVGCCMLHRRYVEGCHHIPRSMHLIGIIDPLSLIVAGLASRISSRADGWFEHEFADDVERDSGTKEAVTRKAPLRKRDEFGG